MSPPKELAKRYADGKYKGELRDGKRFGYGVMEYSNGDVYEGTWNDDKRFGSGKLIQRNGDLYEGMWFENEKIRQRKT